MNYIIVIIILSILIGLAFVFIERKPKYDPDQDMGKLDKFELLGDEGLSNIQTKPKMTDYNGNQLMEETNESELESLLFNIPEHPRENNARILKGETYRKPVIEKDGFHRLNKFEGESDDIFKE